VTAAGWPGAIGHAPHGHFATAERLASWVTLCPGNYISARKSRSGRTGDGGNYIRPLLVQAARFRRLVRKFGGPKDNGARKRAIIAIAHTLLKIAYAVLKSGKALPGARPGLLHPPRVRPGPAGLPAAAAAKAQPRLHRHHHPRGGRLMPRAS
jgi:hypothetical protein